jgi:hypothetical protein
MNLEDWAVHLPFNREQWKQVVANRLRRFGGVTRKKLREVGVPTKIEFEPSVHDMLYGATVDVKGGPRNLVRKTPQLLTPFMTRLRIELGKLAENRIPKTLRVRFDAKSMSLIAEETGGPFSYASPVGLGTRQRRPIQRLERYLQKRDAYHQAGHAVVGAFLFGSLPKSLRLKIDQTERGIPRMWPRLGGGFHPFKRNEIMTLLAGLTSEHEFGEGAFVSEYAKADYHEVSDLLGEIAKDLKERQHFLGHLKETVPPGLKDSPFFAQIREGEDFREKAVKAASEHVNWLLQANEQLVHALAERLLKKPHLDEQELEQIFEDYLSRKVPRKLRRRILSATPGELNLPNCGLSLRYLADPPSGFLQRWFWW